MNKTLKTVFIVVILALAGYLAITFVSSNNNNGGSQTGLVSSTGATDTSNLSSNPVNSNQIGQEFLSQLLNLQAIVLDDSIILNPAYQALTDFTITLKQPGNEGRDNPFAPIGAGSFSMSTPSNVSTIPNFTNEDTLLDVDSIDAEIKKLQEELANQEASN